MMRVLEILLPKGASRDRGLSPQVTQRVDFLQQRMDSYVDKILSPGVSSAAKDFLKDRLRADYHELRGLIPGIHHVAEAVHRLPLSNADFELAKKMLEKPIPAVIAPIYIEGLIEDDELTDQFKSIEETEPARDVRPLIVEWFRRVMPDQMYRFTGDERDATQKEGLLSPIHGYDPKMYKGTNDPITGDAYGRV